ncbi:hypothetical protein BOTBODRAFT_97118, partial [Botryobasidium botryosum FD-172 SS1]
LKELLSMEINPRAAQPCSCNREGSTALYRCLDCDHHPVKCKVCTLSTHQHLALHRIERWDGNHFAATSLFDLGHILYLGHDGDPCPCVSVDPAPSPDLAPVGNKRSSEQISVVHTQGIRSVAIRYCICPGSKAPHVNQLLRAGLVPGTPDRPETAFSIEALGLFHTLNMESGIGMYDYYKTLVRRTDNVFTQDVPDRYNQFRVAMRFWRELQVDLHSGRFLGLPEHLPEHVGDSLSYLCPACPQPGINFFSDEERSGPEYIHSLFLAVDGNFRLQLKKKLRDLHDFHLHDGRAYFRNEEEYKQYLTTVKESKQPATCHSFTAGNVALAGRYKNAVVTGVVAVYCARHGLFRPDSIVDLEKGEKYINSDYALSGALSG